MIDLNSQHSQPVNYDDVASRLKNLGVYYAMSPQPGSQPKPYIHPKVETPYQCGTGSALPEVQSRPCGSSLVPKNKEIFSCGLKMGSDTSQLKNCGTSLIDCSAFRCCGTGLQKSKELLFHQASFIASTGLLLARSIQVPAIVKTPDTHPEEFQIIRGTKDLRHIKSGQIFSLDKKHEDDGINGRPCPHWDVKNEKGQKIMEVARDGKVLWPYGPKGKGSSKSAGKGSLRGLILETKAVHALSDNLMNFKELGDLSRESERLSAALKAIAGKPLEQVLEEQRTHITFDQPHFATSVINASKPARAVVNNNKVSTLTGNTAYFMLTALENPTSVTQAIEKLALPPKTISLVHRIDDKNNAVISALIARSHAPQLASVPTLTPELLRQVQQNVTVRTSVAHTNKVSTLIDHASHSIAAAMDKRTNVTQALEKLASAHHTSNVNNKIEYKNNAVRSAIIAKSQPPQLAPVPTLTPALIREVQQNITVRTSVSTPKPTPCSTTVRVGNDMTSSAIASHTSSTSSSASQPYNFSVHLDTDYETFEERQARRAAAQEVWDRRMERGLDMVFNFLF